MSCDKFHCKYRRFFEKSARDVMPCCDTASPYRWHCLFTWRFRVGPGNDSFNDYYRYNDDFY